MTTVTKRTHILLEDLKVYQLARELSRIAWSIYSAMDWQTKKVIGDQFLTATDSFGANIAEGYARYHYLERIKFFYNARASLVEGKHWLEVLRERDKATEAHYGKYKEVSREALIKLQNLIASVYRTRNVAAESSL